MAHMIDETTGRPAIAYFGETPWHKLGRKMTETERRNLPAAMRLAGVDYDVQLVALSYMAHAVNNPGNQLPALVPDAHGIIRMDTGKYLGTVGASYTPIQNREAFGLVEELVAQGCTIEVMAALDGGRRAFALLRMPDATVAPVPGDDVRGYLLISLSHDASGAVKATLTPIRVVCQNTLTAAFSGANTGAVSIRHTKSAPDRIAAARRILDSMHKVMEKTGETYRDLAAKSMNPQQLAAYIETVIPTPKADIDAGKVSDTIRDRRVAIADLIFHGHHAQDGAADASTGYASAWRAYNAVTEYFDHIRAKEASSDAGRRNAYDSALFGGNATIKANALRVLVAA